MPQECPSLQKDVKYTICNKTTKSVRGSETTQPVCKMSTVLIINRIVHIKMVKVTTHHPKATMEIKLKK